VVQDKPRRRNAPRLFCCHWRAPATSETPVRKEWSLLLEIFLLVKYTHAFNLDALIFIKIVRETFQRRIDNCQNINAVAVIECKKERHKGKLQLMH